MKSQKSSLMLNRTTNEMSTTTFIELAADSSVSGTFVFFSLRIGRDGQCAVEIKRR